MQTQFDLLAAQALKLTREKREALVRLLLASLDEDAAIQDAFAAEIERRIADADSGAAPGIPMEEALGLVRAGLKSNG